MLCSTSLPRLLFWGSVNTGFRLGLLSVVRTTGHASIKMLNVSIKSICLLREKNRRFPSLFFFLLVDSQILRIIFCLTAVQIPARSSHAAAACLGKKKINKKNTSLIRSLQSVTTNFCLLSYLVGEPERDSSLAALVM